MQQDYELIDDTDSYVTIPYFTLYCRNVEGLNNFLKMANFEFENWQSS